MSSRRVWILVAKLALAAVLIGYLLVSDQLDFKKLAEIRNWGWLVLSQVFMAVLLLAVALRWHLLLRAQGIVYTFREVFTLSTIGFYFNQFVPGSTGGDVAKAIYIAVENPKLRAAGITTVFLDRVVGLVGLVTICGIAIAFNARLVREHTILGSLAVFVLVLLLGVVFASLLFFNEGVRNHSWTAAAFRRLPFREVIHKVQAAVYAYKGHPGTIVSTVAISVLVHGSITLMYVCFYVALAGEGTELATFFLLVPLTNLALAVPLTPGGLGVGETASSELFKLAGYGDGALLALLHRCSYYAWALLGLALYLKRKKRIDEAIALGEKGADDSASPVGGDDAERSTDPLAGSAASPDSQTSACSGSAMGDGVGREVAD